jgi:hypothetical protein
VSTQREYVLTIKMPAWTYIRVFPTYQDAQLALADAAVKDPDIKNARIVLVPRDMSDAALRTFKMGES